MSSGSFQKVSIEKIVSKSGYDSWFVGEIREIIRTKSKTLITVCKPH